VNVFRSLGSSQDAAAELCRYCSNSFSLSALPTPPVLPLEDEGHVTDWREYLDLAHDDLFEFLQHRIVQLSIPVSEGVSLTPAYADVVRRGKPFDEKVFGGRQKLQKPECLRGWIQDHAAGALPVLLTSDRADFETIVRALAFRCEPKIIKEAINAQMIAGLVNWDRLRSYRQSWIATHGDGVFGWQTELTRLKKAEKWRFLDRLIVLTDSPYSGVSASELGMAWDESTWRERSAQLRLEHEFTHYTTKRLYGKMTLNLWDELLADWAGMSLAMGTFRAEWFLRFLGLDNLPEVRQEGRAHTYRGDLSNEAFRIAALLTERAANALESLHARYYEPLSHSRFLLALTRTTLDLLASEESEEIFVEAYEWAGRVVKG
jgi:hypothetical protein